MTTFTSELEEYWSWAEQASCIGREDLFYNRQDEAKGPRRRKEERAKRICDDCPVKQQCREHAMANHETYGVWGGLTENERHKLAGRHRTG